MGRTSDAKEKLIDVAFELIWDNSYGGVSVDQICEKAGVNKGSFHHFFGTKANLTVTAYEDHWRAKQPEMDRMFSAQVPPLERLSNYCAHIYEMQKQKAEKYGRACGCPYASIGIELANQDDVIRAKTQELLARNSRYIESAIADAKREGSANVEDPKAAAQQVFSYILGTMLQSRIQNDVHLVSHLEPVVMAIIGAKTAVPA